MEQAEIQEKIFAYSTKMKGKKKLKEKDIIKKIAADEECSQRDDQCRQADVFLWRRRQFSRNPQ
jgi:hypothetical protein